MLATSETPPHRPTYNVRLTETTIAAIVGRLYPNGRLLDCLELGRGKSFNNRIYFLDVNPSSDESQDLIKLVLKLSGHYFDATKIQNEVSALLLLKHFCPDVPVPQLIAWSQTGEAITALRDDGEPRCIADGSQSTTLNNFSACQGWVLQTRLPGRILTPEDLDGAHGPSILRQLAQYMAAWRTWIPNPGLIGNLRFGEDGEPDTFNTAPSNTEDVRTNSGIGGLILNHKYDPAPLKNWADYYSYRLRDQYEHMLDMPQLSKLSIAIQPAVSGLLLQLPKLPFLSNSSIRFTHMDFSPRNTLVYDDVDNGCLRVSGLLDFEFAAFLPAPLEFLNSLVNQTDDWPLHHYRTFVSKLHQLEYETSGTNSRAAATIAIPSIDPPSEECQNSDRCLCSYHTLQHLSVLESIIGSTAPWWIFSNSHTDREAELDKDCQEAAETVLDGIQKLQVFFGEDTS